MKESIHVKYLFINDADLGWGMTVNTIGYQHILSGGAYPLQGHPTRYLFSTDKGRILDEYQLIYITKGEGTFVSSNYKPSKVQAGQMFLLFPGEWHSYQPDSRVGWDEYWIGFNGDEIENKIKSSFFNKQRPIYNVGVKEEIVSLYRQGIAFATDQLSGYQQMLGGIANILLSYAYASDKQSEFEDIRVAKQINKAKVVIIESLKKPITPEEIAQKLNVSYSWFRRVFKEYTGFPPSQYILEARLQKSKELLTNSSMSSREIAYESGFENSDYFCTIFKKKTGLTPTKYRELTQGRNIINQKIIF